MNLKCLDGTTWAADGILEGGNVDGGASSDHILEGAGNDFINSSDTLNVSLRLKPDDNWNPLGAPEVLAEDPGWGIYKDTQGADPVTVWSGTNSPAGTHGVRQIELARSLLREVHA